METAARPSSSSVPVSDPSLNACTVELQSLYPPAPALSEMWLPPRVLVEQPGGELEVGTDVDRVPKPQASRPRTSHSGSDAASGGREQREQQMAGACAALRPPLARRLPGQGGRRH